MSYGIIADDAKKLTGDGLEAARDYADMTEDVLRRREELIADFKRSLDYLSEEIRHRAAPLLRRIEESVGLPAGALEDGTHFVDIRYVRLGEAYVDKYRQQDSTEIAEAVAEARGRTIQ